MSTHVLTDVERGIWIDNFEHESGGLSVRKRTLRGGLSDGVDIVDISNGLISISILPTRGMSLWRGRAGNTSLGWIAPVRGPVHPRFVNVAERGGLGWLTGFDEWLCRCGLNWNGPPGDDKGRPLTLHGRIANQPAHRVEVTVDPSRITIRGDVEEAGLFHSRLRLSASYTISANSHRIDIEDSITNLGGIPAEMQLLYHVNQGPPLLAATSRVHVPYRELWPLTDHAATGLAQWSEYGLPTPGFVEQVFCMFPIANDTGRCLAVLHDPNGRQAMAIRWNVAELPCFTVWKNTAAMEDGYVTGLEPATNFPRFKAKERESGRVVNLEPGASWKANWTIEFATSQVAVNALVKEVEQLQSTVVPVVHGEPFG